MLEPLPNEKWEILDKEKDYMISNYGRCYSIKNNRILKPMLNNSGYLKYDIRRMKDGKDIYRKQLLAHVAVVMKFGDKNGNKNITCKYSQIDHIDKNKFHNTPNNLEIVSPKENCRRRDTVIGSLELCLEDIF